MPRRPCRTGGGSASATEARTLTRLGRAQSLLRIVFCALLVVQVIYVIFQHFLFYNDDEYADSFRNGIVLSFVFASNWLALSATLSGSKKATIAAMVMGFVGLAVAIYVAIIDTGGDAAGLVAIIVLDWVLVLFQLMLVGVTIFFFIAVKRYTDVILAIHGPQPADSVSGLVAAAMAV
jgi:hypothetical protein